MLGWKGYGMGEPEEKWRVFITRRSVQQRGLSEVLQTNTQHSLTYWADEAAREVLRPEILIHVDDWLLVPGGELLELVEACVECGFRLDCGDYKDKELFRSVLFDHLSRERGYGAMALDGVQKRLIDRLHEPQLPWRTSDEPGNA